MAHDRNRETVVAIHCYAGDLHQVQGNLPAYLHHAGSKVVVVSPTDSAVVVEGVDNIHAGLVGYTGQVSLDRQLAQMKALLEAYPDHGFFLLNDADSAVLDPIIPAYLYDEDVVWSNQVFDGVPNREPFPEGWPPVAFQPPYFLSRSMMQRMVAVGESDHPLIKATGSRPFIDFYMVQLTMVGGLPWKRMMDAISWPISINQKQYPNPHIDQRKMYAHGFALAQRAVGLGGSNIVHSVKDGETMEKLVTLRRNYVAGHPNWVPAETEAPWVGGNPENRGRVMNNRHPAAAAGNRIAAERQRRALLVQQQRLTHPGLKA